MKNSHRSSGWGRLCLGVLLGLSLSWLVACGGGGGGTEPPTVTPPPPPPVTTGVVSGLVVSAATGLPVSGARVTTTGLSATTAADGRFTLAAVPAGTPTLTVSANDFTLGVVNATVVAGQTTQAASRLTPVGTRQTVAAAAGATVVLAGSSAQVSLPANGIVDASGAAYSGNLSVALTAINPAQDADNMPGELATRASDGSVRPIESFGAIAVTLADAAGNRLNLATGRTATIRIPLASRSTSPPASVPLFFLDESTGLWVREGSASLMGTAPNQYYEGTVTHFSFWNADDEVNTITVSGCVRDAANAPVGGALVRSDGVDYSGRASTRTDSAGNFTVGMRRGGRALIEASLADGRVSNSVAVGPSQSNITLPACLLMGNGAPDFVLQPQDQAVTEGGFVLFQAVASGRPVLRYQWQRNGVDIPGATATTLLVTPVTPADSGATYRALAVNAEGVATSRAAVLTVAALPPLIAASPQSLTVLAGAAASFSVQMAPQGAPLQYQWRRNGQDIAGATSPGYSIASASLADSGARFSVRVSNAVGSVVSAEATLTVNTVAVAPTITQQPVAVTVTEGQSAQFSVAASGTAPLAYQWRRNGQDIAGANSASTTLVNARQTDSGSQWSVRVSNSAGQVSSASATLTVNAPPAVSGRFLIAGAGPQASGTVVFANGSQSFDSQALVAVAAGAAGQGAVTVEAAGVATPLFTQLIQSDVQAGQLSNTRTRHSLLLKGGRVHIVDHEPVSGTPVSRPLSSLTTGQVCGEQGYPSLSDLGRNTLNDLTLATRSWVFLVAPGTDGQCGTADDANFAVRADMSASDAPRSVPFSPLLEIWGADGQLQGALVRTGAVVQRVDADLRNAQTVFTLSNPSPGDFDETAGFGASLPGIWLFVDEGRLYGYPLDGSRPAPTLLYTFTEAERARGNWGIAGQGQNAYVAVEGGAGTARVLRVTTALQAATEVATGPGGFLYVQATSTRLLFRTNSALVSVPVSGSGSTVTLASDESGFGSFEPVVVAGDTVWFSVNAPTLNFATDYQVRVMQADGANPQTFAGSAILGELLPASAPLFRLLDGNGAAAVLLAQGFTNEGWFAGASLRTVDAASRQILLTLGTVPPVPAQSALARLSIDPLHLGQPGLYTLFETDSESLGVDLLFVDTGAAGVVLVPGGSAAPASATGRAQAQKQTGAAALHALYPRQGPRLPWAKSPATPRQRPGGGAVR